MNKKKYIAPQIECGLMEDALPLCSSGRSVQAQSGTEFWDNENIDVTYGGVDDEDDGLLDPS